MCFQGRWTCLPLAVVDLSLWWQALCKAFSRWSSFFNQYMYMYVLIFCLLSPVVLFRSVFTKQFLLVPTTYIVTTSMFSFRNTCMNNNYQIPLLSRALKYIFLYTRLKNGTYYVTGYSVRPTVRKPFSFRLTPPTVYILSSWNLVYS